MRDLLKTHDFAIAALIVAAWTASVVAAHWGQWSIDMSAIYLAGYFAASGEYDMIYAAPPGFFAPGEPVRWGEVLAGYQEAGDRAVPFIYPPIWAFVAAPLAGNTDPQTFFDLTRIFTIVAFGASILVAWRLMRPAGLSATAFAVISIIVASLTVPFQFSASLNQLQTVVILLILCSFERYLAGRGTAAGICLGLAGAIKISPILLVVIFIADREWRPAAIAIGTAAGVALLSLVIAGPTLHWTFLENARQITALVPLTGYNMTFETFVHDFFVPLSDHPISLFPPLGVDAPGVALAGKLLMPLALISALLATRGLARNTRLRMRLILIYTAVVWFGPVAWMHYYTLPLLLIPGLLGPWNPRAVMVAMIALMIGFNSSLAAFLMGYTLKHGTYTVFYPQHTALIPLALVIAGCVIWSLRQGWRMRQGTPATV